MVDTDDENVDSEVIVDYGSCVDIKVSWAIKEGMCLHTWGKKSVTSAD